MEKDGILTSEEDGIIMVEMDMIGNQVDGIEKADKIDMMTNLEDGVIMVEIEMDGIMVIDTQ